MCLLHGTHLQGQEVYVENILLNIFFVHCTCANGHGRRATQEGSHVEFLVDGLFYVVKQKRDMRSYFYQ
jgi:hypothetical protein